MGTSLGDLTTPEQYIKHYYDLLKSDLNKKDLQISKVGVIGYLLNVFGYSQFDIKQYFDSILKEAFVATSDIDDNLNLHASIYRYTPLTAVASSVVGNFQFDFTALPTKSSDVATRNIFISGLEMNIEDLNYILDSKYVINNSDNNYVCQITDNVGGILNIPFLQTLPQVLIKNFYQYLTSSTIFNSPNYTYGTYYAYIITIDEGQYVSNIDVYVNDVKFDVRTIKWTSRSSDNAVFIRQLTGGKILLELGSGLYGKYIPNSEVKIIVKTTNGTDGNVLTNTIKPHAGSVSIIDTLDDQTTRGPIVIEPKSFLTINVEYSENGLNPLVGDDLRAAILDYIGSRDNLISKSDFDNLIKNLTYDNFMLFKKTDFVDNIIYNFAPFMNKQIVPVRALSHSMPKTEFDITDYRPTFTINSESFISPFMYVWDDFKHVYDGYIVDPVVSASFSDVVFLQDDTLIPPALSLRLEYSHSADEVQFDVTSYENLLGYDVAISIPEINISDQSMVAFDSNTFRYIYSSGLIYDSMDISLTVSDSTSHVDLFTYSVDNVKLVNDVSDVLFLKTYGDTTTYVLNVPVMPTSVFEAEEDFYLQKFISLFGSIGLNDKCKMISDEVQMRFINSNYISSTILRELTTSGLDFDLILPFKIQIDITGSKEITIENNINITSTKAQIEFDLAEFLLNKYTGTQISFYKTQIIDFIHNFGSFIKSVDVTVTDSSSPVNEIVNGNFETYEQDKIFDNLTKLEVATYCPIYFWWDLNNITINVNLV